MFAILFLLIGMANKNIAETDNWIVGNLLQEVFDRYGILNLNEKLKKKYTPIELLFL